jgi:hypothetical protein
MLRTPLSSTFSHNPMQLTDLDHNKAPFDRDDESAIPAGVPFWRAERTRSILLIGLIVLVANCTYLVHAFDPNPIVQDSGLGTVVRPGLLAGQNNIDPNIGFTAQALGHRAAVDWLHGDLPWWNPYEGIGAPLAGEMQSAALFPLDAFNLLPGGQVFFRITLEISAGIGTYLLVRRFTKKNLPAVVGGIAFAVNGTFSWLFHAPGNPVAFLPFLLLGIEWAREGAVERRRSGWVLIAVSLALSLYAGFPETAFIDAVLAALWLLVRLIGLSRQSIGWLVQSVAIGGAVGALLAAPILVAFVDYLPYADVGGHGGSFATASLGANTALPAQIMPYFFGPIFGFSGNSAQLGDFWGNIGGYFGAGLSTLGIVGLAGRSYRPLRIALGAWIAIGLARLVGVGVALDLINAIPGIKSTAFYRYAPVSWEMALVVLAVLGLDDILRRSVSRLVVVGAGGVMVILSILSWRSAQGVLRGIAGHLDIRAWAVASFWWALLVVVGIVILAVLPDAGWLSNPRVRQAALGALIVIDCVAMFAVPQFSAPREATIDTRPVTFLTRNLGEDRFYTLGPIAPNYGSYFTIASLGINDLPIPKSYAQFVKRDLNTNVDPLSFQGTTMANPNGPTPAQELVTHLSAYEALGVKYVILPGYETLPGKGASLRQVFRDAYTRIVELPHPALLFGASHGNCAVSIASYSSANLDCAKKSTIVYRELSMPGWTAQAGGRQLQVHHDGPLFQSVEVPAGRSTLEFSFNPPHITEAIFAFVLGLLCLLLALPRVRQLSDYRRGNHVKRRSGAGQPTPPASVRAQSSRAL